MVILQNSVHITTLSPTFPKGIKGGDHCYITSTFREIWVCNTPIEWNQTISVDGKNRLTVKMCTKTTVCGHT